MTDLYTYNTQTPAIFSAMLLAIGRRKRTNGRREMVKNIRLTGTLRERWRSGAVVARWADTAHQCRDGRYFSARRQISSSSSSFFWVLFFLDFFFFFFLFWGLGMLMLAARSSLYADTQNLHGLLK